MNPNMRIPVMDLGNGDYLTESNAIVNFLADGTLLLPDDRYQRALVLQWQFFEQYSHEPYIATARFINKYLGLPKDREAEYHGTSPGLRIGQLGSDKPWLRGDRSGASGSPNEIAAGSTVRLAKSENNMPVPEIRPSSATPK